MAGFGTCTTGGLGGLWVCTNVGAAIYQHEQVCLPVIVHYNWRDATAYPMQPQSAFCQMPAQGSHVVWQVWWEYAYTFGRRMDWGTWLLQKNSVAMTKAENNIDENVPFHCLQDHFFVGLKMGKFFVLASIVI